MKFRLSRKKWQFVQYLGLFCCCCLLVISCGSPQTSTSTGSSSNPGTNVSSSDRISVGSVHKPRTLDPADGYEVAINDIITSLGDRLYTYVGDTDQLEPQLATELPEVSDDGLNYTIPLRQGVTFHDGEPFNAAAMAFSLKRFSENGGKPSALLSDVMESVEATGEYELTIKLKNPFAPFPSVLAFPGMAAVSPKAYEIGEGKFKPNEFVGTGPYKLVSFNPNLVKVDVFDEYWGEKPPNQGIDFQFLSSAANLYNSFTTGAVDIAYRDLNVDQILSLKQKAEAQGYQVLEKPSSRLDYLVLNVNQKPLDQVEVRQAIASMIDRSLIIDRVYRGQAEPAYSIIPSTFETNQPVFKEPYGDGNIEKTKELLTKAGFSKEKPFEFEIWYASDNPERQQIVTLLKEYAAQNLDGLMQVKPQPVESTTLFSNVPKGIYPSYLVAWFPDFGDADNYISPFFSCTKGSAETGCQEGASQSQGFFYYSEKMNQLIEAERKEQDPKARKEIFADIQELIAQDVPLVPLLQKNEFAFAQKPLKNIEFNPVIGLSFWEVNKEA
ncbi:MULTISPECIES: ABC transporter substrate-binding protein [unclassified Coleofasciculus]|uniref:ABC transporter substrate-binding protein n=1 Tax=unclassified Coleofasciculus TaxID=2692782 RepID=UPI00187F1F2B|nr:MULTISPECIES: ABC transporter substrate-binding protein [unclassified Coleofasciculus]MBE9129110.1 peptide ABC transporter substrate-binding protein [Coleofasciculus sp. LEGE 07081]MBE9151776.1 peptide ABC transporter substrate-binding protein [Coleofasciculus sp. LEGE 07092]